MYFQLSHHTGGFPPSLFFLRSNLYTVCSVKKCFYILGSKEAAEELVSSIYQCVCEFELLASQPKCAIYLIFMNYGLICHIVKGRFVSLAHWIKRSRGSLHRVLCTSPVLPRDQPGHSLPAGLLLSGTSPCCCLIYKV